MSDTVQQIKEKLNIIDVISPYVELHKAGKNFKGKSPFSAEKTPSFYVSPDRGMYYCFSTTQGGDIFNFIQAMEGVDFKGALKILADKAGVELVPEDPKKRGEKDRQLAALEDATVFYSECLDKEKEALEYLEKRGVSKETVAKWRIGYAPGPPSHGWREVKDKLEGNGYTKDELLRVGLVKNADAGKEPFDVFRDRVVFPMSDASGRVVAFSGRILHPNDKAPKYVNSPETELYKKSELLYGYDKAKAGIRNLNFSLIVEGQFDVVMCHQAGYSNTVAVSGTALTLHHVQLLERMSDKVVLALDADRAGINAMKKGAVVMLERGLDVKVAEMPLGEDPADMIVKNPAEFKKVIGKSVHVIEFLLHVLKREAKDERDLRLSVGKEIYPFVLLLPGRVEQYHFAETVAKEINSPVDTVWYEIERLREKKADEKKVEQNRKIKDFNFESQSENVPQNDSARKSYAFLKASLMVIDPALRKPVEDELPKIIELHQIEEFDDSELSGIVFNLEQQFEKTPELAMQEELVNKLNHLKNTLTKKKISGLRNELVHLETGSSEKTMEEILKEIQEFEKILKEPGYTIEIFAAEKS